MTALRDWAATVRILEPVRAEPVRALPPGDAVEATGVSPVDAALRAGAERQRIALQLHDDVAPLLFAMAGRIRRALDENIEEPDAEQLLATLHTLAGEVQRTQVQLRAVIRDCAPVEPAEAVPAAAQRDIDAFTERTGVVGHLLVQGRPENLPVAVERVALNCLRQALVNIDQHADASVAVITLAYRHDRLCLVVQDDGQGLPIGFEPRAVPVEGHHWGFTSMAEQVERLGGSVLLRRIDDGGTQLRVELPVSR
jgi:signal transduction histidine kinase